MKRLFISIHDVSPKYETEIKRIIEELHKNNINKYNLLVTINFEGKWHLSKHPSFVNYIKKSINKDKRLVYHGDTHTIKNSGFHTPFHRFIKYFEFSHKTKKEIINSFSSAKSLFNSLFNIKKFGFVPPVWYFPKKYSKITLKYFEYYANSKGIQYKNHFIQSTPYLFAGDKNRLISIVISYFSLIRSFLDKSRFIRFSIHPSDVTFNTLKSIIKRINSLKDKGYKLTIYEEKMSKTKPSN